MRLSFVTPLCPPDVHAVALYHKALVSALSKQYEITAIIYGTYPEAIRGVKFVTVDKQTHKRTRVFRMITTLFRTISTTDVYLVTNGPSTELPALLLSYLTKKPIVLLESDSVTYSRFSQYIHTRLQKQAAHVLSIAAQLPHHVKPEIHPLLPYPTTAMRQYEITFATHIANLVNTIHHVTTS
jgi:hypothetical protein